MKTLLLTLSLLLFQNGIAQNIDFFKARKNKQIKVENIDVFEFRDHLIKLKIRNLSNQFLTIIIPLGTVFIPKQEDEQTLVVAKDHYLELKSNGTASLDVAIFCTELHDYAPVPESIFNINISKDDSLLRILNILDKYENIGNHTVQESIWAYTDGESIANIQLESNSSKQHKLNQSKKMLN